MIPSLLTALALAAPVTGELRLKGAGDPLPAVEVRASTGQVALSDADGRFSLDLPDGRATLVFESLDYLPLTLEVQVPAPAPLTLFLAPARAHEVVVEAFKPSPDATRHIVDAEQAMETPGTLEDTVRLVQALPGVAVQREYSPQNGSLSVRGSSGWENRYYLDGIEVPYLYHFKQYASVFPTAQIDTLELYPSSFGPEYGDATGGVVEAISKADAPKTLHGTTNLNYVMGGASLTAPLQEGWWISGAGRRSFLDSKADAQYPLWPRFYDFALRVGKDTPARKTQFFAMGASDSYDRTLVELDVADPAEALRSPTFSWSRAFQIVGGERRWSIPKEDGRIVVALVRDAREGAMSTGPSERVERLALASRGDAQRTLAEWLVFAGGWELRGERADIAVGDAGPYAANVAAEAPALGRGVPFSGTPSRARVGLYAHTHLVDVGHEARIIPGLRLSGDTLGRTATAEPRVMARWRAADQTELKLAGGRYTQAPDTLSLLSRPDLPRTSSWQVAAGIEQTVANRLELLLDAYAKRLKDPLDYPSSGLPVVYDRGDAWGLELTTRYRLREVFFLWAYASVARTHVETPEGRIPTDADQPYAGGLVASWDVGGGWTLGARYRVGAGLPLTPILGSVYDGSSDAWRPIFGEENSERYPAYQKIDGHLERTWVHDSWTLSAYLEAWYVPKSSAQLYPTWSYDYAETGWVMGPTFFPLLGARASF
ncbi:MAG: TonB-dependent receptor plug domain-containing protein [Deltaproteobacteria bacterium]|nr:TonB-dependent receptor plug domain-containing protein [Deltaproteobacteria bacterium]